MLSKQIFDVSTFTIQILEFQKPLLNPDDEFSQLLAGNSRNNYNLITNTLIAIKGKIEVKLNSGIPVKNKSCLNTY